MRESISGIDQFVQNKCILFLDGVNKQQWSGGYDWGFGHACSGFQHPSHPPVTSPPVILNLAEKIFRQTIRLMMS